MLAIRIFGYAVVAYVVLAIVASLLQALLPGRTRKRKK